MTTRLPIVGTKFRGPEAEEILKMLPTGQRLILRPEPENRFDPNAKAVILVTRDFGLDVPFIISHLEWHLGFIPRTAAEHPAIQAIKSEIPVRFRVSPSGIPQIEFFKEDLP